MEQFNHDFLNRMGNPTMPVMPSESDIQAYQGRLPDALLDLWRLVGWSGFHDGLFWLVEPDQYSEVLNQITKDTEFHHPDDNFVIGRGAFGILVVWNKRYGGYFYYDPLYSWLMTMSEGQRYTDAELETKMKLYLSVQKPHTFDEDDKSNKPLFQRALKKLGPLSSDEMYGFEPALLLGGDAKLANLKKLDIVTHLSLLNQLKPTEIFNYSNYM